MSDYYKRILLPVSYSVVFLVGGLGLDGTLLWVVYAADLYVLLTLRHGEDALAARARRRGATGHGPGGKNHRSQNGAESV
ncbi:unnamed protein product [Merluccius merluccius]